jgi:hypothetical protein
LANPTWHCEHPDHEGSRLVETKNARFTKRVTYMRADGGERLFERSVMRLCRKCVHREADPSFNENQGLLL